MLLAVAEDYAIHGIFPDLVLDMVPDSLHHAISPLTSPTVLTCHWLLQSSTGYSHNRTKMWVRLSNAHQSHASCRMSSKQDLTEAPMHASFEHCNDHVLVCQHEGFPSTMQCESSSLHTLSYIASCFVRTGRSVSPQPIEELPPESDSHSVSGPIKCSLVRIMVWKPLAVKNLYD